jgi:16S rRNA (adenine1518-N6/adenine1519-N6)-dimethyltransferase
MTANTRDILAGYGLAPSKKRGQNFLKHRSTALRIVAKAEFTKEDHIMEVGVGLGALTLCLAEQVIVAYLQQTDKLPDNVTLLHEDVLKSDFKLLHQKIGKALKIISNLPYSISNPFIFKLIDNRTLIERVVILLQKEMAQRLTAPPNTKEYGIPSVLLQSCAEVRQLMEVGAAEFHPRPKVDSLLIEIRFDSGKISDDQFKPLRDTVRAAFSARRKTLSNNLTASLPNDLCGATDKSRKREFVLASLEAAGLKPDIRAENITVEQFRLLARNLQDRC